MSFVNRQLYKQKPQAWGPVSSVQASIFKNAEIIGIDPASIVLAMPMWGPGDQIDYASYNLATNYGATFEKNAITVGSVSGQTIDTNRTYQELGNQYTIFLKSNVISQGASAFLSGKHSTNSSGYSSGIYRATVSKQYFYFAENSVSVDFLSGTFGERDFCITADGAIVKIYLEGNYKNQISNSASLGGTYNFKFGARWSSSSARVHQELHIAILFSLALAPSQIAHLSDNPYFLLHRVPTVFYSVPGGGVLPTFNPLFLNAAQPTRVIQ